MVSLLTASGGRLELAPNRMYVLGRDTSCDFVLDDVMCSRHHARITVGGTGHSVLLEDLGSKNGTFVDGDPLKGRALLTDGSRIQLGSTIYMLSLLDAPGAGAGELLETGTVAFERGPGGSHPLTGVLRSRETRSKTGFAGQLALFTFIDVLQLLMRTARNGTLHLEAGALKGRIDLRMGEVHAAKCGSLRDIDALARLARLDDGLFWMVETEAACKRTMQIEGARLLFELCRMLDEDTKESP